MRWALIVVIGVLAGFAAGAKAALLAYEGFNYPAGSFLEGQSGGGSFGFSAPWQAGWMFGSRAAVPGLSDPTGALASEGGRIDGTSLDPPSWDLRPLAVPMGQDSTVRYICQRHSESRLDPPV